MDTLTITTPNNYVVELKRGLSYRHHLDIQSILMGDNSFTVDAKAPDTKNIEMQVAFSNIAAYRQKALEYLVVKVINPDKSEAANPLDAVLDMPVKDGELVAEKVAEVTDRSKKSPTSK